MVHTTIDIKKGAYGKSLWFFIIASIILSGFISCNFQKEKKKQITEINENENYFPYNLQNPDTIYSLPGYLEEISGISCYKKNKIACVQDEHATIYIFDTKKGKLTSKRDFGKDGDYEDIAVVGDDAYVIRSNGTIFKIKNFEKKKKLKIIKIKTSLNSKNNTEGLFFHKNTNSLLIACKDSPSINKKESYESYKAIYSFDLKRKSLIEKPEYLIDLSVTDSIKDRGTIETFYIESAKKLGLLKDNSSFHPSGIAVHPFDNNNLYIISGVERLLIIMNKTGLIIDIHILDKRIFNQPESICFSEKGDMYISNEGKSGRGNIIKFKYKKIYKKK